MERESEEGHWADRIAAEVVAGGRPPVLSTGISPSGEIHIGNMREVLTADAVFRALRDRGADPRFNYVADNFDPLRKVYPFLDAAVYGPLVGRPLSEIPCPCGDHESYAEHFLLPFLDALTRLGVDVEVERADRMYKDGRMNPQIVAALKATETLATILRDLTGKEVAGDWSPFNPLCASCGRIDRARVTGFSAADETVAYRCACGVERSVPMAGGGKLTWRVDWPARWSMLGVTVEPFGKDHATRGGSYDTGVRMMREVFGGEPPHPIPYEWIRLQGGGDMSSSKGNVLSIAGALEVAPPEALRYLVMRERPQRTIRFDPGLPLLQLVDAVDDARGTGRDERAVELSMAGGFRPVGVPFKHLVVVTQIASYDPDRTVSILERSGYPDVDRDAVVDRIAYARRWVERYAPDDLRIRVCDRLPSEVATLSDAQRRFLGRLADTLSDEMDGEAIHAAVYDLAASFAGVKAGSLFQAVYVALLGRPRGPRAGWFIELLGIDFCRERFREAAGGTT